VEQLKWDTFDFYAGDLTRKLKWEAVTEQCIGRGGLHREKWFLSAADEGSQLSSHLCRGSLGAFGHVHPYVSLY